MAELLIQAKSHWMDKFTQEQVDKMSIGEKRSYSARAQIGDVIVVCPDGWKWGREECLPNYVVIKVPTLTVEEAKKYDGPVLIHCVTQKGKGYSPAQNNPEKFQTVQSCAKQKSGD